ncbi:hypothetical protein [Aurantiacibacter aquimixticola]|uniref:Uncharacterized protein n=1 Tax=Aurantiacibacter aquimixticola TaxID=1958945 RepID=A0A419RV49_9SPHN|nr:hypothetical protein [Aurantiacibacter aquimixticola]RJY09659.1 hypothetical protein D6201_10105 [Aurantiacibacter aquimixticola]
MSRKLALPFLLLGLPASPAGAQEAYGPQLEGEDETPQQEPITRQDRCETEAQDEDVILVCAELPETERYLSPIPRPTRSDRRIIPGLTDPPCWVTNPGPGCIRFGWAPEPALMVDTTAFAEPLSAEDAALVSAAPGEQMDERLTGERVPIDLSDED